MNAILIWCRVDFLGTKCTKDSTEQTNKKPNIQIQNHQSEREKEFGFVSVDSQNEQKNKTKTRTTLVYLILLQLNAFVALFMTIC